MKKQKLIKVTASMDLPVGSVGTAVPAGYNGEVAIIFEGKDLGLYGFNGSSWSLLNRYSNGDIHYVHSGGMERYYVMSFTGQEEIVKISFFSTGNISSSIPRISSTLEETKLQDINEVPPYTAGDENKMLTVLSDGSLAWLLSNQNYIVDADGNYGETIEVPVSPWDSYGFIEERNDVTYQANSYLNSNGNAIIGLTKGVNGDVLNVNGLGAAGPYRTILQSNIYTVSMWVNFTDMTSNGQWGVALFGDHYRGVTNGVYFFYKSDSTFFHGGATLAFPGLNSGTWRHVVLSRNGNVSSIYVDGVLVGNMNVASYTWRTDTGLQFGNITYGTVDVGANPLMGMMDKIQVIDYSLNSTEVADLYAAGHPNTSNGLNVSQWDNYSFIEERNDVTWGSNSSLINGIANIGNSIGINGSALNVNGLGAAGPFRSILQSNSYSVSMWINFTDITSNGQWGVGLFADQYRGVGSGINFFYISTSKFSCNEQVLSFPGLNSGTWRHVVFSRNGNASKIYVDGVLVGTINVANFNWRADSGLQFGNACYGSRDNGINPLNGMMDRIQIIDYPLIDTEVTQLYNEGYAIIN